MTKSKKTTRRSSPPKTIGFFKKLKWIFTSNPKHEISKKQFHLDLRKREIKAMERGLKTNVDKLHDHTIKLAKLQKHIFTNHEQTYKELEELKEFHQEKKEIEHVLVKLNHLLGHIPDEIAEEFSDSKDFQKFKRIMAKYIDEYKHIE